MLKNLFKSQLKISHQFFKRIQINQTPKYQFKTSQSYFKKNDLYDLLGVAKDATQQEIKQAFYKGAQKWHPDRNSAPDAKEKFAELNNAYETLGDEKKRKIYDQMGLTGDEQNMGGFGENEGANPFSGFGNFWNQQGGQQGGQQFSEEFFGDFENFFNMGAQGARQTKGQDIFLNMEIDFMESIKGGVKRVIFEKKGICPTCNGSKAKPGTSPTRCSACGGKGTINYRQGSMVIQITCNECKGAGVVIKSPCEPCRGIGIANVKSEETVTVPPGINTGQNLRMTGKGNQNEGGGKPGDLLIKINIKPDPYFIREGYDIYTMSYITISEAVLGTKVKVQTLNGTQEIPVKPSTEHGDKYILRGQGISKLSPNQGQKGDQIVIFKIHIPKELNQNEKDLFQKLGSVEKKIDPKMNYDYNRQQRQGNSQKQQQQQKGEQDHQDDIFSKFKSMWK